MKHLMLIFLLLAPVNAYNQIDNTWNGNIAAFNITPSGQMQFTSPAGEAGNISVWKDIKHEPSMSWDLDVKLSFTSTNSNNLRVYVHKQSKDSLYIQIGNNDGQVSLYEKKASSSSPKLLIAGRKSLFNEAYAFVSVRLTIENDRTWTLYTRKEGEEDFYKEGDCKATVTQEAHSALLKLELRYIKGRVSVFTLDNINVYKPSEELPEPPAVEDYQPIELTSLELISENVLQFCFNKAVNIDKARCYVENIGNAAITGYGENKSAVNVSLPQPLQSGVEYTFTWSGLYDMEGRPIEEQKWNIVYENEEEKEEEEEEYVPTRPSESEYGQIIISEVMANPNGLTALPQTEYVELMNNSENPVSLKGWSFVYDGKETLIEGDYVVQPLAYAVLSRTGRDVYVAPPSLSIQLAKFPSALANTGKTLALLDATAKEIDRFSYPAARAGISWERSTGEHHLCTDPKGGTPGAPNSPPDIADINPSNPDTPVSPPEVSSIKEGDIVFNELLPNPFTDGSEYIELYNRTESSILLSRLSIAIRRAGESLSVYPLSGISASIKGKGYALLTAGKAAVASHYIIKDPEVIYEVKLPQLSNKTATLLLIENKNDAKIIDEVTYSSHWHSPLIKEQKGVALERIDADGKTQDPANWTSASSVAGYGTPGYINSQQGQQNDEKGTNSVGISAPTLSNGVYSINYNLGVAGYACRIYIYNISGYKVAEISNNILTGVSGSIVWDGRSLSGVPLETGVYIFYAELYHPSGISKQHKSVFLVKGIN